MQLWQTTSTAALFTVLFGAACGSPQSADSADRRAGQPENAAQSPSDHHHDHAGASDPGHPVDRAPDHGEPGHAGATAAAGETHAAPLGHRFEHADDWSSFDRDDRAAWQKPEHVVELMKIVPGMTVADLGAGTGYFLPYLARAVGGAGGVLALDIEPDMVRHLEARAAAEHLDNVTARQVAVDDPGLADHSVDRVLIVNTWHHIPDRRTYAAKLARALRPGGAVVVVDFTADAPSGPPASHRLAPAVVIGELAAAGLDASTVAETLPRQYVVVARRQ